MNGEGQVVQLRVRAEHDALRQRIDRAGTGERLRERVALAVSAADVAIPAATMVADAHGVAAGQAVDRGIVAVGDVAGLAVADEVVHLVEVERHVVRVVTSTVDGLVDVRRHQIDDALLSGISIDRLLISIADGCENSAVWSATLTSTVTFVSLVF